MGQKSLVSAWYIVQLWDRLGVNDVSVCGAGRGALSVEQGLYYNENNFVVRPRFSTQRGDERGATDDVVRGSSGFVDLPHSLRAETGASGTAVGAYELFALQTRSGFVSIGVAAAGGGDDDGGDDDGGDDDGGDDDGGDDDGGDDDGGDDDGGGDGDDAANDDAGQNDDNGPASKTDVDNETQANDPLVGSLLALVEAANDDVVRHVVAEVATMSVEEVLAVLNVLAVVAATGTTGPGGRHGSLLDRLEEARPGNGDGPATPLRPQGSPSSPAFLTDFQYGEGQKADGFGRTLP